jgi:hypothetical protein
LTGRVGAGRCGFAGAGEFCTPLSVVIVWSNKYRKLFWSIQMVNRCPNKYGHHY